MGSACETVCETCREIQKLLKMHDDGITPDTQKLKLKKFLGRQCQCRYNLADAQLSSACPYAKAWTLIYPTSPIPTLPKKAVLPAH